MIRKLLHCQTHDPGRGSFLVKPRRAKSYGGRAKTYLGRPVMTDAYGRDFVVVG